MSNKTFYSNSVNWLLLAAILLIFVNAAEFLVSILYEYSFNLKKALLYSFLTLFFLASTYFRRIEKIEIRNDKLIIFMKYKTYKDSKCNFQVIEELKVTRTLHKYKRLILKNKNSKKRFVIDSDDWKEYKEIKEYLMEPKDE
jgi:hypothetical protein